MIVKIRAILFIYTPLNIEIFECKDLIKERGPILLSNSHV